MPFEFSEASASAVTRPPAHTSGRQVKSILLRDFLATDEIYHYRNRQRAPLPVLLAAAVATLSALGVPAALRHILVLFVPCFLQPLLAVAVRSKLLVPGALSDTARVPLTQHGFSVCKRCAGCCPVR